MVGGRKVGEQKEHLNLSPDTEKKLSEDEYNSSENWQLHQGEVSDRHHPY